MTLIDPQKVRQLVLAAFRELSGSVLDIEETIRIGRGKYLSRTYHGGTLAAVWDIESGILQVSDSEGIVLRTIHLADRQVARDEAV